MNDEMENFERRLKQQPLRQVPAEWRAEILAAAQDAKEVRYPSVASRHSWLSNLNAQLSALLWPHPRAWAGLAAVWILIFAVNFSIRDKAPVMAEKSTPPSPEVVAELKQQLRMLAELIGPREPNDADQSKSPAPRPRSERPLGILVT